MNFTVIIEAKGMQDKPTKKVGKADNLIFFQAIVRTILKKKKKSNIPKTCSIYQEYLA